MLAWGSFCIQHLFLNSKIEIILTWLTLKFLKVEKDFFKKHYIGKNFELLVWTPSSQTNYYCGLMRNQPHAFLILCVLWKIEVIIILLFCCMVELGRLGSTLLFLILNRMWCWTKNVHPNGHSLIWTNFHPYLPFLSLLIALSLMRWKRHMFWLQKKDIPHHDQQAPDSETNCKWNYEMKIEFTRIISSW